MQKLAAYLLIGFFSLCAFIGFFDLTFYLFGVSFWAGVVSSVFFLFIVYECVVFILADEMEAE